MIQKIWLVLFGFIFLPLLSASAQQLKWEQLLPDYINSVYVNSGTIFLGTSNTGIYRLSVNGDTLRRTKVAQGDTVNCFTSNGLKVLAGSQHEGVIRSLDNGASWMQETNIIQ